MPYRISRLGHVEIRSLDLDRDFGSLRQCAGLADDRSGGENSVLKRVG